MPLTSLRTAKAVDLTPLLERDYPAQLRRSIRAARIRGFFGEMPVVVPVMVAAAVSAPVVVSPLPILAIAVVVGVLLAWFVTSAMASFASNRASQSLEALAEERYGVHVGIVWGGTAVVNGDPEALNDLAWDLHDTLDA